MAPSSTSNGRLSGVVAGGIANGYRYNGMAQRVAKTGAGGVAVHYVYDEAGRLLGEYDGAGKPIQETVYLGDLPVAVMKPGTTAGTDQLAAGIYIYYVYADHLSTPRVLTRASDDKMVWRWDNADPFGLDQPNQDPSRLGVEIYNPRFPGQVFDSVTNNYYNYYRDYDPQTGRYIESDPIGLDGGVNSYAHVGGNPMSFFDSSGLIINVVGDTRGDYRKAINYLSRDPAMKRIIDRLNKSPIPYTISINSEDDDGYDEDTMTLDWDPHSALCLKDNDRNPTGASQSPALGLGHELDHMANMPRGVWYKRHTRPYGTPEEQRVIEGSEAAAAASLNEGTRHNHYGKPTRVTSPTRRPTNCECKK